MSCPGCYGCEIRYFKNLKNGHFCHFCHFWQNCEKVVIFDEFTKLQPAKILVTHFRRHKFSIFSSFFKIFNFCHFFKKRNFWKNVFFHKFQKGLKNVKQVSKCWKVTFFVVPRDLCKFWKDLEKLWTGFWHLVKSGQKSEKRGSKNGGSWKHPDLHFFALIRRAINFFCHFLSTFWKLEILRFDIFSNILTKISTGVWKFWKVVKKCVQHVIFDAQSVIGP